jgi:hypothetical protein
LSSVQTLLLAGYSWLVGWFNSLEALVVEPVVGNYRTLEIVVAGLDSLHSRLAAAVVLAQSPFEIVSELDHRRLVVAAVVAVVDSPVVVVVRMPVVVAVAEMELKIVPLAVVDIEVVVVAGHIEVDHMIEIAVDMAMLFAVMDRLVIVAMAARVSTVVVPMFELIAELVDTN